MVENQKVRDMGPAPITDMQNAPPAPLKSDKIGFAVQKDAQCSGAYEKNRFCLLRFLFLEK